MSDIEPTGEPAPAGSAVAPQAAAAAAGQTVGGGVTFDFVFNGVTYTVQVYAPDNSAVPQYGFAVTQAGNTIASLIYRDDNDWAISVGLPSALQVDTNLTVNKLNIDINKGTVSPLS
jgi:hypothetical protein